jgi:CMP-N-acetylneuraminic acid synthetase
MKIVCFVPIKLNSQRLPNKMLLPLGDKLLCQHIFYTLLKVKKEINIEIYCFCSNEKIKEYLPNDVLFLKRDDKLDSDQTLGIEIYTSFVNKIDSDIYILCHATSPFITSDSIISGINKILYENYDSACSVSRVQTFCWYKNKPLNYDLKNVIKTQDITPIYWETSAFYMFKKEMLVDEKRRIGDNPYLIETNRIESIDIDEKEDYDLALKIANDKLK